MEAFVLGSKSGRSFSSLANSKRAELRVYLGEREKKQTNKEGEKKSIRLSIPIAHYTASTSEDVLMCYEESRGGTQEKKNEKIVKINVRHVAFVLEM